MGILIGKFLKKKSTYERLEKLENEIIAIEEFGRSTEQTRKRIIGRFVILAISMYIGLALLLYYYYQKVSSYQRLVNIIPLIAVPFIMWFIKKVLTWYFSRKIKKNEKKLVGLKEEKKKIIDTVMETETYKVAKKILDKFGTGEVKKPLLNLTQSTPLSSSATNISGSVKPNQSGLRQRNLAGQSVVRGRMFGNLSETPRAAISDRALMPTTAPRSVLNRPGVGFPNAAGAGAGPGTPLQLPRGILPQERSVLDKMVDYLIGDGPSNRYALICKKCNSHNGMALKEEFEYLSYRCCYCATFNPGRKKRPSGPNFESNLTPLKALTPNSSESEKNSSSESEDSSRPVITELRNDSPDAGKTSDFDKLSDLDPEPTLEEKILKVAEVIKPIGLNPFEDEPMEVCPPKNEVDGELIEETRTKT